MTVRWVDILGQLARSTSTVGNSSIKFLRAIMFLTVQVIRTLRIPNSSVRTNSLETRRTSSLSLKNMTELYEIYNGFTRRDWQVQDFELSITWKLFLSISSTPFNSTVFPMTQERENETTKTKVFTLHVPQMNTKSSRSHQFLHFQSLQKVFRISKSSVEELHFQGSTFSINIKLLIDLQTCVHSQTHQSLNL